MPSRRVAQIKRRGFEIDRAVRHLGGLRFAEPRQGAGTACTVLEILASRVRSRVRQDCLLVLAPYLSANTSIADWRPRGRCSKISRKVQNPPSGSYWCSSSPKWNRFSGSAFYPIVPVRVSVKIMSNP